MTYLTTHSRGPLFVLTLCALVACGSDDEMCDPSAPDACEGAQICAALPSGASMCVDDFLLQGIISDALTGAPIEGARIIARDANGAPRSEVARSAADGSYSLPVAVERTEGGIPTNESGTTALRVDASGYQAFPTAPRVALPIDLASRTLQEGEGYVVRDATTDVALIPLETGGETIAGRVDHPSPGGILVVGSQGGTAVSTSVTDQNGDFLLFNVPSGTTGLTGYHAGISVVPQDVNAPADGIVLATEAGALATVSGSISIVNAPGGVETSVILVPAETFDATAIRGEAVNGLRAAPVTGSFQIESVPPGRYAVLAAFENDLLVRDPDEGISGTEIVFVDVASADITIDISFKVTEALVVVSPGAEGLETISASPTLTWADDSSEDGYELRVYNAFGDLVFEDLDVPRVTGEDNVEYPLEQSLEPGMVYQFRAYSWRERGGGRTYISSTEDLLGVFMFE
ncbi:MAG: hypothetical protein ACI9KE_002426 [Polyangiales bacterium]|jgi:hypothetical protein